MTRPGQRADLENPEALTGAACAVNSEALALLELADKNRPPELGRCRVLGVTC